MPRNNFFQAGGSLKKDFPGYVERPADREIIQYLQQGYFCYVLTARQMGKSSLKVRCIQELQALGWTCIDIDITSIGSRNSTAEQWYYSILAQVAESLDLEDELDDWWDDNEKLTPVARMSTFWGEIALPNIEGDLVIFMDEIDSLLSLDPEEFSTDDFFASIRALYNRQSTSEELRRLHFCILGVATPDDLMVDPARTPFNIGQAIHLDNLKLEDATPLQGGLEGFEASAQGILQEIIHWSGGQPYLTQRLCATIAAKESIKHPRQEVRQAVQELFLEPERVDQDSNLANVNRRFRGMPEHLERMSFLYRKILDDGSTPLDLRRPEQIYLKLSGLVKEQKNTLVVNNQIYAHVFNRDWLEKLMGEFQRPFQSELKNWLDNRKDDSFLLRGKALEDATVWSYTRDDVNSDEIAFLEASRRNDMELQNKETERKQLAVQRRRLWVALVAAILAFAIATITSIFAFRQQRLVKESNLMLESQADSLVELNRINKATQLSLERSVKVTERANMDLKEANDKLGETQKALQNSLQATQMALQRSLLAEENAQKASKLSDSVATVLQFSSEAWSTSLLAENLAESNPNLSLQLANYAYENYGVELTRKNLVKRWVNNNHHQKINRFNIGEILTVQTGPFDNLALTGGQDGEVLLWKIKEGEVIQRYRGHTGPIVKALFSPDSTKVITAAEDATIRLWDLNSGRILQTFTGHIGQIYDIAFAPNSRQFASIGQDQNIIIWDITSGTEVNRIIPSIAKSNGISCLSFSPNSEYLLAGGINGEILLFNLMTNQEEYFFYGHQDWVNQINFLQNGNQFVSASRDGLAILWDLNTGRFIRSFVGHQGDVRSAIELPNTNLIITGSEDQQIYVWNAETGEPVGSSLKGHLGPINDLAILPNTNYLLSCAEDNTLQVWDVNRQQLMNRYTDHSDLITALQFIGSGKRVITGHSSGRGYIWSATSGRNLYKLTGHSRAIECMASSRNDQRIVTGGLDGKMILRDGQGAILKTFAIPGKIPIHAIAVNQKGTVAATASADHVIRIWDLEQDSVIHSMAEHTELIQVLSFSPNEDYLISGSKDETLVLWDYNSGYKLETINTESPVSSLSFHPVEPLMAIGLHSGDCMIMNYRNGEEIRNLSGHSLPLKSVAFSKDGSRILTGGTDNTFILWHESGRMIKSFAGHQGPVLALAFQDQNNRILSASQDQTARSWEYRTNNRPDEIPLDNKILALAEHPDSNQHLLAVSMVGNKIEIINQKSGLRMGVLNVPKNAQAVSLAFHPTLGHLYAGLDNGSVFKWEVNEPTFDKEIVDLNVRTVADVDTIKTENDATKIKKVDTTFVSQAFVENTQVSALAISADGFYLLAGASNGQAKLWDLITGELKRTYSAHLSAVTCIAFHPQQRAFISGSDDNTLRYWSFDEDFQLRSFLGHQDDITDLAIDPKGQFMASTSEDETINIWDIETTELIRTIRSGHSQSVQSVNFHPYLDPPIILTCSNDQTCRIWDVESGESIQILSAHKGPVLYGVLSVHGKYAITISEDQFLRTWNLFPSLEEVLDFVDPLEELLQDIPGDERSSIWPNEYLEKEILKE